MFERRPELVRALLGDAGADLPAPVRVAPNEFSHYKPTAYLADRVLVFGSPPDEIAQSSKNNQCCATCTHFAQLDAVRRQTVVGV